MQFLALCVVSDPDGWRAWLQKERNAGAREYSMAARKSTNWASVAPRTLTRPNACHSLKAAERGPVGAHSLQPLSGLPGASRGLSAIIRVPYGSGTNRSRAHSLPHKLARNSGLHLARNSELHLARNSRLRPTAHGEPHKLAQQRKGEELARESKGEELAQHGKDRKLEREGRRHKLGREGRRHKLREAVGVTNCAGELATFKGQKCNDKYTLWLPLVLLMLRNVTKNASSTNVLSVKMPIVQMYYRVKMILILSPTGENRAGGLIRP